jgi:hypothetical protein
MSINQTPGEIYFIRERDFLSHETTNYVKVGLVREKDDRDSEERLLEHQTGNPRELFIHHTVKTPAVSAIEGLLHGLFAQHRVSGEWFDFAPDTLERCIEEAEKFAKQAEANISTISEAARLKDVASDGSVIEPTPEIQDFFSEYSEATFCLEQCEIKEAAIKDLYIKAAEADEEVEHLVEKQERKARKALDKKALQSAHPDVFAKYITSTTSISGRATFASVEFLEISMTLLGPDTDDFMMELQNAIHKVEDGEESVDYLQDYGLQLTQLITAAEWLQEISMANIKAFCGQASEVAGILKWNRKEVVKESFNEKLFKESEPDLYEEFSSEGEKVVAHKVKKSKAAPQSRA